MNNSKLKCHLLLPRRSTVVFLVLYFSAILTFAQVSRYSGQIPIGNSDTNGFARIDKEFYDIPLGNGSSAELFFKFSTDPRSEPKYMGAYWTIPFFESNVVKISSNNYRWIAPNLRIYTFNKTQKNDIGYKETYILNTTGKLKLNVAKDDSICIENVDDPKNRYLFRDGKLVSFCEGKDTDIFRISYENNRPRLIYNLSRNSTEVEFIYNREGFLDKIVMPKDKKILFVRYGVCNTFAEDGITKQGDILSSVSSITFADGKKEVYKYSAESGKKNRNILIRNDHEKPSASVSINKFEQQTGEVNNGFIEWDATTGIIVADSGGEYAVRNPIFDKYSPEYMDSVFIADRKREMRTKESRISYKRPEHKYHDIWDYSLRTAIKMTQDPNTGEQTRTSYIGAFGNAAMKIRKIEKRNIGEKDWKMFVNRVYDADGDILREKDSLGILKEWKYEYIKGTKEMISYLENSIPHILKKFNNNGKLEKILRLTPKGEEQEIFDGDLKRFYLNGVLYKEEEYLSGKIQRVILYNNNEKQIININDLLQNL